ncbi:helix-turn-helix domain-containing protein [Ensifer soli]|uniref:helix-turn-helix domain-containing protein n=1 Tax=Ciceribacter sp. sgz301302 TaxID=3342379 RepID=UPI0035B9A036
MAFEPRMHNRISGFSVGGFHRRHFDGVVADVWDVDCAPSAGGTYVAADPRLFVVLEARGGDRPRIRLSPGKGGSRSGATDISYIPAEMELEAELSDLSFVRHLDLHFNVDALSRRLKEDLDPRALSTPRLMFSDPRLMTLAGLIAAECASPAPLNDLYGDGLTVALFVDLMRLVRGPDAGRRSRLAGWQLRRATAHIEENCLRNVRLEELAQITGLSQSHFSHAFKASTGMAPHAWQMQARIGRAKTLMLSADMPLTAVATETGFSDQAHFTRVFRKAVGVTPGRWKKSRLT